MAEVEETFEESYEEVRRKTVRSSYKIEEVSNFLRYFKETFFFKKKGKFKKKNFEFT